MEVDDELRRERLQKLWQRFGQYLVILSIAVVVVTAAIVGWKSYQTSKNERFTAELLKAQSVISSTKPLDALPVLTQLMDEASPNVAALARLWAIQLLSSENKKDEAKALADAAEATSMPEPYGDILSLYKTVLGSTETQNPTESEFSVMLKEAQAVALIEGNPAEAKALLKAIEQDAAATESQKERAMLLLSTLKDN
jgi:hypothetical protein